MNEKNINETLQSIEGTLERIEEILLVLTRPITVSTNITNRNTDDLVKEHA